MESFWVQFLFVHLLQSESRHGGEECHTHENNFYGYRGRVQKYGILRSLRYIYLNPFRFLISSLGGSKFPSRKSERARWQNVLPTLNT